MAISSTPRLSPDDVARHTFATARRGFDPDEVRAYLEGIASEIRARDERERELQQEVGAAEERAANPVLDDATLTAALGAETARVLRSAHEAAGELVSKAETEATRLLTESRQQIEEAEATAEAVLAERTAQADTSAADVRKRAHDDAAAQMDATRNEVESMLAQARTECRDMLDEAQGLRTRVLADLSRRRKVLHAQIEQLRAGREHLAEAVRDVRRSIDTIADDLFRAEDEARLAAEAAGREAVARADEGTLEEEAAALSEAYPGDGDRGETPIEEVVVVEVAVAAPESSDGPGDEAVPAGAGGGPPADAVFAKLRAATEDAGEGAGGEPGGQAGESSGATAAGDEEGGPMPPPTEVTRRDEALGPIVTALARRLKRTLQDDQNDVLDRLRSNGSTWSSKVLPPEPEHRDGFATAALPHLEDAALAGLRFAGGKDAAGPKIDVLIGIADGLADEVVGSLRRRARGRRAGAGRRRDSGVRACGLRLPRMEGTAGRATGPRPCHRRLLGGHAGGALGSQGRHRRVGGRRRPGFRAVSRLRGQRTQRPAGTRRGVSDRASTPSGPPRLPLRDRHGDHVGSLRALTAGPAEEGARRGSRRRRRLLIIVAVVLVVLIASLKTFALAFTDYLWFGSLDLQSVWIHLFEVKIGLFVTFAVLFGVLLYVNLKLSDRLAPRGPAVDAEDEFVRRYQEVVAPYSRWIRLGLTIFLSLVIGSQAIGQWNNWILFRNAVPFPASDPCWGETTATTCSPCPSSSSSSGGCWSR